MSNINDYSATDLIYLFLDGKADGLQKKKLFGSLAEDADLQSEFQDALSIRNAFAADKEEVRPPATLTAAVFASAGFGSPFPNSAPSPAPQPVPVGSVKPFLTALMSKLSHPLISGALSTVATAAVFLMLINPLLFNNKKVHEASDLVLNNNKQAVDKSVANATAVATSTESAAGSNSADPSIKEKVRYIYITREVEKNTEASDNSLLAESLPDKTELSLVEPSGVQPDRMPARLNMVTTSYNKFPRNLPEPIFNFNADRRISFSVEFRGVSNLQYFPKRSIEPQQESILNNISAAILLDIDKHNSLGLEAGQESFQMYMVKPVDSTVTLTVESGGQLRQQTSIIVLNKYENIPSSTWFGTKYRYTFDNIVPEYKVSPFVSATAGYVANIGFLLKPAFGMIYNPENTLFFSLGLEYSTLFYKQNNNIQSPASKVSVFYNMGYHF